MAPDNEPQEKPKQPQPQQGGGGGNQPQRRARKPFFHITNVFATLLYGVSALITAVAAANVFIPVPPTCRDLDGMVLPVCQQQVAASPYTVPVLFAALIIQILVSVMFRFVRDPRWQSSIFWTELAINIFGLYWLVCVRFGYLEQLRGIGRSIGQAMNLGTLLGSFALIGIAIFLQIAPQKLYDQQVTAPQQPQKR